MRGHGELYAKDLLAIADEEPGPELLPSYDLRQLILESDEWEPEKRGQSNPLWDRKGKGKESLSYSKICLPFASRSTISDTVVITCLIPAITFESQVPYVVPHTSDGTLS
jgi:hypothetical protein